MTKALQSFTRSDGGPRATKNQLILPEPIEAVGAKLGISHRVHDIAVTQEVLQRAGIDAVIGELEAAGMAQHVRMNREGQFGQLPSPTDHFEEPGPSHRPTALGVEDVAALQVLPSHLAQCPDFLAGEGVCAVNAVLGPPHMDAETLVRFDYALKELSMPFDTIICAITSLVGRRNIGDGLLMAPND